MKYNFSKELRAGKTGYRIYCWVFIKKNKNDQKPTLEVLGWKHFYRGDYFKPIQKRQKEELKKVIDNKIKRFRKKQKSL